VSAGARGAGRGARSAVIATTGALAAAAGLLVITVLSALAGATRATGAVQGAVMPGVGARVGDIPAAYLRLYVAAAESYGVDWAILSGIGKVECDHGRDPDPSCTRAGAVNTAGAGGPMQFLASTWARYGVDGDTDGRADRWDPADAVYAAANYLRASGFRRDPRQAIFAYNNAVWYVEAVESVASRYREAARRLSTSGLPYADAVSAPGLAWLAAETSTPVIGVAGPRAQLDDRDGHVALIPIDAPPVVQALVVAGNELQGLAYGQTGHPDPRGASTEDCSSTINYLLYRAGVEPISEIVRNNPLAQTYVRWGAPGRGRWLSIYATASPTPHVFATVAGLRIDTSHNGTDVGPNSSQDGPRWRLSDQLPTWARWSVRHPPGL
jgi:hypothetical protein